MPKWEISIETGNVLIWAEQGLGDEIFFARFLPLLKKYRATFYLECDKRLHEIIKYNNPNLKLLDRKIIQDFKKFDFQIAFGDLFAIFSEHINDLNRPYIKITVRPEIKILADTYKNKTIVGVSWRTLSQEPEQQKLRNVDLIQLSKNLNRADTVLVVLQPLALESEEKEFLVLNCPPGAGKSTLFHDVAVWCIVRNRAIRVLIGSISQTLAKMYSRRIRETLERPTSLVVDPEQVKKGLAVAGALGTYAFGSAAHLIYKAREADKRNTRSKFLQIWFK